MGALPKDQRFTRNNRCPICGGGDGDKRGQGQRCIGFASDDGDWVHCSREEHAGSAPFNTKSGCYVHKMHGPCKCGVEHGPDVVRYNTPGPRTSGPSPSPKMEKSAKKARSPIVATYDYCDGVGELLFQVCRTADKDFLQRRPDGNGGWIWDREGVEPVLFHLPEIVGAAPGSTVWVTEGEKDAKALRGFGLNATCNPGGAGKWLPEMGQKFRGLKAVVIPDHDKPGRDHADAVCKSLKDHAADIRVLDLAKLCRTLRLDHLKVKGDVSDFLDMGGTVDQLVEHASKAPNPYVREYHTLADAISLLGDQTWFWDQWIPSGCLSLLAAVGGGGKTRTAADWCKILWFGLPMPDGSTNPHPPGTKTLWLMYDRNFQSTAKVFREYGIPLEAAILPVTRENRPTNVPNFDDPDFYESLEEQVRDQKPGLILVDTITFASNYNTARAEEAKRAFDPLILLATETGVPVLGLTHLNKDKQVLNVRITERARSVLLIRLPDPAQPNRRRLWVDKCEVEKPPPLGITMTPTGNEYDNNPPDEAEEQPGKRGPKPAKSTQHAEWLVEQLSRGPTNVSKLVEAARTDGVLTKPTAEKPKPAISPLYNAKDRVPFVKAGWSIYEDKSSGRAVWSLVEEDDSMADLNLDNWPIADTTTEDALLTHCSRCGQTVTPENRLLMGPPGSRQAECWACNAEYGA